MLIMGGEPAGLKPYQSMDIFKNQNKFKNQTKWNQHLENNPASPL